MHRNTKSTKVMSKSHHEISHLSSCMYHILCVLGLTFLFSSCGWQEAKEVIAWADSIDQTEHMIYDDTIALGEAIRSLDNPLGRVMMSNTLGKAYYYMGRNLEDDYQQVAQAAKCYIEADRLQINDPIYRGRVNACIGYICRKNKSDSLAIIYYERATEDFKESKHNWMYAQSILNLVQCQIDIQHYSVADSLLRVTQMYQLDSAYQARRYEKLGLYFYAQQQYDSALVYFNRGLDYWQSESEKCFCYLKIMQIYYDLNELHIAIPYAKLILSISDNPNYISNAYYCLMQDAKSNNNAELLSQYSHARTDAQQLLREYMLQDAEALPILEEYMQNPHPLRWVWIVLCTFAILCVALVIGIVLYRRFATNQIQMSNERIISLSAQVNKQAKEIHKHTTLHHYDRRLENLRKKYPHPLPSWNKYKQLKKDLNPYLKNWFLALEELNLTPRDNVFCVLSFIYPQMPIDDLASSMCITKDALFVRKTNVAKKLGITSSQFSDFLQKLPNSK